MRETAEIISGPRKGSMPTEQKPTMVEGSTKELGEIRREVIEARNLVIKNDNLLKNLHAELKAVNARQEEFQKRQWRSSAMAYALFTVLAIGGAVLYATARTSTAGAERERLEKTVAELSARAEKSLLETRAQEQAQRAAADVYKLMTVPTGDERLKGVDALLKLDTSRLSMLERAALDDRAQLLRREVGQSAFERGRGAVRRNDMAAAVSELNRFLAMNPDPSDAVEASYLLGTALNGLKKHDQAIPYLARFVAEDKKAKTREYAMLLLTQSYEVAGQLDKAAETAREALSEYPAGEFNLALRNRLNALRRLQAAAVNSPAAQPVAQPQAPVTAPAGGGGAPGIAPGPATGKPPGVNPSGRFAPGASRPAVQVAPAARAPGLH